MPTIMVTLLSFNTQPPEGGWLTLELDILNVGGVSTHSRPKAAGPTTLNIEFVRRVSTHSRPKAAGTQKAFII